LKTAPNANNNSNTSTKTNTANTFANANTGMNDMNSIMNDMSGLSISDHLMHHHPAAAAAGLPLPPAAYRRVEEDGLGDGIPLMFYKEFSSRSGVDNMLADPVPFEHLPVPIPSSTAITTTNTAATNTATAATAANIMRDGFQATSTSIFPDWSSDYDFLDQSSTSAFMPPHGTR
jgi:hypothetical protein